MPAKSNTSHPHVFVIGKGDDEDMPKLHEMLRSNPHHHHGSRDELLAHSHQGTPGHHHSMTVEVGILKYDAAVFGPAQHKHPK